MRYLFVIPALNAGGAERVMVTLANELALQNNEITILTLNTSDSFYTLNEGVSVYGLNVIISSNKLVRILTIPIKEILRIAKMSKFIKSYKPDIIVSFLYTTNVMTLILHKFNHIPLIVSERNDPTSYSIIVKYICKYIYPSADIIVCQGTKVSNFFSRAKKEKIEVIPNPINIDSIPTELPLRRRKTIVAIGRLIPQKNFDLLIESFSDICDRFPNYTLEIYGKGYLKEKLENKIELLGLQKKVKLIGVKKNVMHYINDSQLFVMSSDFEGFPNALVEAMASGLPVISTDFASGIAKDLIEDYVNGLVVPVNNKRSLSKAIEIILEDYDLQEEMSINNRKIINELSSVEITKKWNRIFKQLGGDK